MDTTLPHDRQHQDRRRKRSCSPYRYDDEPDVKHARRRSPHRRDRHESRRRSPPPDVRLPFHRTRLHKSDFAEYSNLLAEYLDVQKRLDITAISSDEVKGRWKSFLGKWNRRELAEGWYDPDMKARIDERFALEPMHLATEVRSEQSTREIPTASHRPNHASYRERGDDEAKPDNSTDRGDRVNDGDDDYGPAPPDPTTRRSGPAIPSLQDLQQRNELAAETRKSDHADLRLKRRAERQLATERMDELAPRAAPGSRERQVEKRRERAVTQRGFREAKSPGAEEVGDGDLMGGSGGGGGGDDGPDAYRARLRAREKIKTEREIRKEEILRARAAEREERMAELRRREEKTMEGLKAIAKLRYG